MSSQCIVPEWNLSRQRQVQVQTTDRLQEEEEEVQKRFPNVHNQIHHIPNNVPNFGTLPNYGVAELTWENGHPTTHGLGGLHHSGPTKPTWVRPNGTLESIVHQATYHNNHNLMINPYQDYPLTNPTTTAPAAASGYHVQSEPAPLRKRRWSDSDMFTTSLDGARGVYGDHGACASASATFCRDHTNDTNTMACDSFASPPSLKAKTIDEDSDCAGASEQNNPKQNEDREVTAGSHSSKRTRVAAVHNLSERKRRDRINQKMRALQKLVPNANKTDKSSMLDEAISYLKQLQAQVHLMSGATPLGMQQQQFQQQQMQQQYLQMSLMAARMGMNTDMFGMSNLSRGLPPCLPPFFNPAMAAAAAAATPTTFVPPLMVPPHVHVRPNLERSTTSCSVPLPDPYRTFLAQSMNMDLYSKMATFWGQQINQATTNTSSKSNLQDD